LVQKEEDEVLYALTINLRKVYNIADEIEEFVPLLVSLCSVEEVLVREASVGTLIELAKHLRKEKKFKEIVPVALKMSKAKDFPTLISSIPILVYSYKYAILEKKDFRS
jgi:hypothetical protein